MKNEINESFKLELADLINRHCLDTQYQTPDYVLADLMVEILEKFMHGKEAKEYYLKEYEDERLF